MSIPDRYLEQQRQRPTTAFDPREAQGLNEPKRDTVHSRLDATAIVLAQCESLAMTLGEKLVGQSAGKDGAPTPPPSGVHALAQDVHARGMRLAQLLGALNEVLA